MRALGFALPVISEGSPIAFNRQKEVNWINKCKQGLHCLFEEQCSFAKLYIVQFVSCYIHCGRSWGSAHSIYNVSLAVEPKHTA